MGRDFSMVEDGFGLSLELSIGGSYGKSGNNPETIAGQTTDPCGEDDEGENSNNGVPRSDFSCAGADNGCEFADLHKRREIQAIRRQEARKKREEKLKKSRGLNGVDDKLILEAQQFQARVKDREARERDGFSEDSARGKDRNETKNVGVQDLNISLFTENKNPGTDFTGPGKETQCLFSQVQFLPVLNGFAYSRVVPSPGPDVVDGKKNEVKGFLPVACRSSVGHGNGNASGNSSMDCDSGDGPGNSAALLTESLKRSSSAGSDHQSTSQKGGSCSDSGSHASSLSTHQNQCASRNDKVEFLEAIDSFSRAEPDQGFGKAIPEESCKTTKKLEADPHPNQTNNTSSTIENPTSPPSKEPTGLIDKPPKPPQHHKHGIASAPRMHRVSTTGNGPKGRTVTGFLYRYTRTEVSIMCVCHGSSFSPAEFVEHAGGVDVSNPLRHITVVPWASE
ncbi:AFP homolog 2-like [Sesamum indicum]|uniref:Ninja-family protein n=1 Tax=Sesamum indicum TaxID=4182 RepID=A0A6I9TYL2_SESIN|nr:AFP homolog 2-like [Sesamum indicum]